MTGSVSPRPSGGPKLRTLGVSQFTVGASGPGYDLSGPRDRIAWRDSQD